VLSGISSHGKRCLPKKTAGTPEARLPLQGRELTCRGMDCLGSGPGDCTLSTEGLTRRGKILYVKSCPGRRSMGKKPPLLHCREDVGRLGGKIGSVGPKGRSG